jgi:transposase
MCMPTRAGSGRISCLKGLPLSLGLKRKAEAAPPAVDVKTLHAKIGALTLENDFLADALGKAGLPGAKR